MATWMDQKVIKIKLYKRRLKLGPNVSLDGNPIKPFDAKAQALKDKRIGLPLTFNEAPPRQFKKTWKSSSGCNLSPELREKLVAKQAARLEFLAGLRGTI
jgi:hypothetical protein